MKVVLCRLIPWFVALSMAGIAGSQSGDSARLEETLRKMESVGKTFRSFQAKISQKKYTAVLKEFDTPEYGEFYYARAQDGSALIRQEMVKPGRRTLTVKGGVATIYTPGVNQAQIVNLGKNKDKTEYLALGLGQSPGKLRENFDIQFESQDKVGTELCSVLVFRPKNPSAAAYFSSITLWISRSSGIPVQQKLQEPNRDFLLVNFTDIVMNRKIPDSKFEQKFPPGVEIQRIQ